MNKEKRELHQVVIVTRECEIGHEGERAVVIELVGHYMTLLFPDRAHSERIVRTGADYLYLHSTAVRRGVS
jgi:hypothetical protein